MHTVVQIHVSSGRGRSPIFVMVEVVDYAEPDPQPTVTWHKLAELAEGGHAISEIGALIKPAIMAALKAAGLTFLKAE